MKCNIDGAVPPHEIKIGYGFVIRNQNEELVAAKNGSMDGPTEAIVANTLSCRETLYWIKRNGLYNIIVESDTLVLGGVCFFSRRIQLFVF